MKIDAAGQRFTVSASKVKFDGFMSVYVEEDEKEENNTLMKGITKDTKLTLKGLEEKQHFTQPAPHYTEASLVRSMEELGIGRPSTYAPTITTILARRYIVKENRNLYVTELGEVVNNMMKEAFPSIVDVNFTATMEALLDGVEEGSVKWKTVVSNFYPDLSEAVDKAERELDEVEIADELSDEFCDACGRQMAFYFPWKLPFLSYLLFSPLEAPKKHCQSFPMSKTPPGHRPLSSYWHESPHFFQTDQEIPNFPFQ